MKLSFYDINELTTQELAKVYEAVAGDSAIVNFEDNDTVDFENYAWRTFENLNRQEMIKGIKSKRPQLVKRSQKILLHLIEN